MQNKSLTIGSYNVKRLTLSKFIKYKNIFKKILKQFDKDELLVNSIIKIINQSNNKILKKTYKDNILKCKYNILSTPLLGKTKYKERIYVIYNNNIITVKE